MTHAFSLFVRAAFVENLALSFFLGMCMFLAVLRRMQTALGLGIAVFVVQSIPVPVNHLIHAYLLREGRWRGPGSAMWTSASWRSSASSA
jgi:Na+-transporting NADH:ubiquinone oxidoreductase subunit E